MPRQNRIQDEIESEQENIALNRNDSIQDINENETSTGRAAGKSKTKVKSKKHNTASRKNIEDPVNNSDVENDAIIPFNREEFLATARPIKRVDNIDGVMFDLQHLIKQVEHIGFELVTDTAMAIEEVSGCTKDGQEVGGQLDSLMRSLIDAQEELKAHEKSLYDLKQRILRKDIIEKSELVKQEDLETSYIAKVDELKEDYSKKTLRQKYARHEKYFNFKERVWEVTHEDAMPPLKDLIPAEVNDSEDDSDIEVGGKTQNYKCPLTLRPMENPVTSVLCGHSFSFEGIKECLQNGSNRCPATGCQQRVTLKDFRPDEELAHRVALHLRRVRRKEEDNVDDDAEIID
ncbi:hypothetical protein Clacol_009852 [Clathrus columnatus]|uniref:SP-RING-type domain-containing protein n=1 Tax=Clathrus columnatus TaxID=1419009 RepID=A0AAV5AQZ4_9AGAM|nr:hypothetical protein Clacol_009852 [Clathrus columnatus]